MACIMAIDHDHDTLLLLETILTQAHEARCYLNPPTVTEADRAWADLIVLDYSMPGESGPALARRLGPAR